MVATSSTPAARPRLSSGGGAGQVNLDSHLRVCSGLGVLCKKDPIGQRYSGVLQNIGEGALHEEKTLKSDECEAILLAR